MHGGHASLHEGRACLRAEPSVNPHAADRPLQVPDGVAGTTPPRPSATSTRTTQASVSVGAVQIVVRQSVQANVPAAAVHR